MLATGGSDVAENYPSNVSLYAGDIVSTLEHGFVTLAQKVDEAKILGVGK